MTNTLHIRGARTHNLKNISLDIPRNQLVVITGLSGSGKSSLAFDTLYAEGQRRYVESLSTYARQFLHMMDKPDVDAIEGLSPAISIEQKTTSHNPRSTVGTVTEIHDYLRLLYARVGVPYCPDHSNTALTAQSVSQMVDAVLAMPTNTRLMILAPIVTGRKGEHADVFRQCQAQGFIRFRLKSGTAEAHMVEAEHLPTLKKNEKHTIEVVVDRIKVKPDIQQRLAESFETALRLAHGRALLVEMDGQAEHVFSNQFSCIHCGYALQELEPRLFSFNNPMGACSACDGLGYTAALDKKRLIDALPHYADIPLADIEHRYRETNSAMVREELAKYLQKKICPSCQGARLRREARQVKVGEGAQQHALHEIATWSLKDAWTYFQTLSLNGANKDIAERIIKEIVARLKFLNDVGLSYLSLERSAESLSGGEAQRIRLASQIGSGLTGVMYVLDEPSIGLHSQDNDRLIATLHHLRDLGNTVLVVEHDEDAIRTADFIVDMGLGAGEHGGEVIVAGNLSTVLQHAQSLTAQYLNGTRTIAVPAARIAPDPARQLLLKGASGNNLKQVSMALPIGLLTCVTGVSGSGKSTLINDTLYHAVARHVTGAQTEPAPYTGLEGLEHIDKVIAVDQAPIGRTPRSNPATYTGIFTPIRELFSNVPTARERGYNPGRFSFNVKGGRCETCQGDGVIKVEMHFLPDVYVACDLCHGKRYNRETLEVFYKGKNISDVLAMTVEQAEHFFCAVPVLARKLHTLIDVGLGYLRLGQSATTLSGGEAQRVKLSLELSKRDTGRTLYILDEPTTGLHFYDIELLLKVIQRLRDQGNTIVIIEHNLEVIKTADWVIDLGPQGGGDGGKIVATGTPESVAKNPASVTGQYLKKLLDSEMLS